MFIILLFTINLLTSYDYCITMSLVKFIHKNCVNNFYPFSEIKRFPLTADQIPWSYNFSTYNPSEYNSKVILNKPWADPPLGNFIKIHLDLIDIL